MESVRKTIDDLRAPFYVVSSLIAQILLIVWSRQRVRNWCRSPLGRSIWMGIHFLADYCATVSLWLTFYVYIKPNVNGEGPPKYYLAYWVPFALLNLGRPGKITSFSLQDNEFWPKQAVYFILYACVTLLICILACKEFKETWPSLLVFIAGGFKISERIWLRHHVSLYRLKLTLEEPDPASCTLEEPDPAVVQASRQGDIVEDIVVNVDPTTPDQTGTLNAEERKIQSENEGVISLCKAYKSFSGYKGLYANVRFKTICIRTMQPTNPSTTNPPEQQSDPSTTPIQTNLSLVGDEFLSRQLYRLIRQIEIELGFAYDLFYSKRVVAHSFRELIIRVMTILLVLIAVIFYEHKHPLYTKILPITSLVLEFGCLIEAALSKWMLVNAGFREGQCWRFVEQQILEIRDKFGRVFSIPWPDLKLGQQSILSFRKDRRPQSVTGRLIEFFELKELFDNTIHTKYVELKDDLKLRIAEQILQRLADEGMNDHIAPLRKTVEDQVMDHIYSKSVEDQVMEHIYWEKLQFGEIIIIWHLATSTLYSKELNPDNRFPRYHLDDANVISNYMMYLLVEQPSMLSSVGADSENLYKDACIDIERKIKDGSRRRSLGECVGLNSEGSKFLAKAKIVASALEQLSGQTGIDPWELLFKVWVDMLTHAAYYCKGKEHAQQLITGGELLTFVWIFLFHCYCYITGRNTISADYVAFEKKLLNL